MGLRFQGSGGLSLLLCPPTHALARALARSHTCMQLWCTYNPRTATPQGTPSPGTAPPATNGAGHASQRPPQARRPSQLRSNWQGALAGAGRLLRGCQQLYLALDAQLKSLLVANLHSIVTIGLIVGLLMGMLLSTAFLGVQIG